MRGRGRRKGRRKEGREEKSDREGRREEGKEGLREKGEGKYEVYSLPNGLFQAWLYTCNSTAKVVSSHRSSQVLVREATF